MTFVGHSIECGAGWNDIICPLIKYCEERNIEILQIKEKLGTLRFYVSDCSDELALIIEEAYEKSRRTCELCGRPGTIVVNSGVYMCRCEECLNTLKIKNRIRVLRHELLSAKHWGAGLTVRKEELQNLLKAYPNLDTIQDNCKYRFILPDRCRYNPRLGCDCGAYPPLYWDDVKQQYVDNLVKKE